MTERTYLSTDACVIVPLVGTVTALFNASFPITYSDKGTGSLLLYSSKINFAVLALWWFSLLNTATYFHTLLEKVTGLLAGLLGWYIVHVLTTNALTIAGIQEM
jgi:hypothetical protein